MSPGLGKHFVSFNVFYHLGKCGWVSLAVLMIWAMAQFLRGNRGLPVTAAIIIEPKVTTTARNMVLFAFQDSRISVM